MFGFKRREATVQDDYVKPQRCKSTDDTFWYRCEKVEGHKYNHSAGGTGRGDDWTWNDE